MFSFLTKKYGEKKMFADSFDIGALKNKFFEAADLFFNTRNSGLLEYLSKKDDFASPHVAARWLEYTVNNTENKELTKLAVDLYEASANLAMRGVDATEMLSSVERRADKDLFIKSLGQMVNDAPSGNLYVIFQNSVEMPFDLINFPAGENSYFFIFDRMVSVSSIFLAPILIIFLFMGIGVLINFLIKKTRLSNNFSKKQ